LVNNADGRAHVEHCADVMDGYTLAAEGVWKRDFHG
jgi:hypothetical protein